MSPIAIVENQKTLLNNDHIVKAKDDKIKWEQLIYGNTIDNFNKYDCSYKNLKKIWKH